MTKGYDRKNLKAVPSPNTKPSNPPAEKAEIALLIQKIAQKISQDPQGPQKASQILSEWLNLEPSKAKKKLKKTG